MKRNLAVLFALVCMGGSLRGQDLWIDFNSTTQDGPAHNHPDYQAYDAGHEVADDFVTMDYEAFGTTVSFTPSWPDTEDNRVMQSIDRNGVTVDEDGFETFSQWDLNWFDGDEFAHEEDMTRNIDLVTDWIGADTRTGNGGNGDFDGDVGDPTRMLFTMSGIPAGEYSWTSFHHDTEFMWGAYWFDYSVDGGETFQPVGDREFRISKSSGPGNPPSDEVSIGGEFNEDFDWIPIDVKDLPSTVSFDFATTGDDVVLQFTPLSELAVHNQFVVVNGFQLAQTSVAEPGPGMGVIGPGGGECDPNTMGDLDGSGDVAFADFLILSNNFGQNVDDHTMGDIDCSGDVAFADFLILSNNFGSNVGAQSVPEPAGFVTFGLAALFAGFGRRRRNA